MHLAVMRRPWFFLAVLVLLTMSVAAAESPDAAGWKRYSFSRPVMGSIFRIELYAKEATLAEKSAEAAFQRVEALNQIASDYLPESELSRLNRTGAGEPVPVSPELFDLIVKSVEFSRQTQGAFDITAAYAVQHWRRARRQKKLPTTEQTRKAVALTDWTALKLDAEKRTVTKLKEFLLDLGGIGKGYAADEALAVLRQHGITMALVAGSGDLAIGDAPPGQKGWKIALRTFEKPEESDTLRHVVLANCGCSTSGDLHQFLEIEGKRYSHIVDPRTGLGLTERIACTVISPDATTSDALATAYCVMGMEAGMESAARQHGVHMRFSWIDEEGRMDSRLSGGFPELKPTKVK